MPSAAVVIIGIALAVAVALGAMVILNPPAESGQDVPGLEDLSDLVDDFGQNPASGSSDTDGDGIADEREAEIGTDPYSPDTDGDTIPDGRETESKTDPKRRDSDRDGIDDPDEQSHGTDPTNGDTDGDGIGDGDEVGQETDPGDSNTDDDRYRDNEDPDPASPNSAVVRVAASDLELQESYKILEEGAIDPSAVLARVTIDLEIRNDGDDYASFVKFDGVFSMDGVELKRVNKDTGRIEPGEKLDRELTYSLKISDIPAGMMAEIIRRAGNNELPIVSFEIENVAYERF